MTKNLKLRLLTSIGKIFDRSKDCKLEPSVFRQSENEMRVLSEYFNVSGRQSFFIASVFALNYKGDTVDLSDLIGYYDCNPVKILEYSDDFELLYSKGIFRKQKSRRRMKLEYANDQFVINEKITEAILLNRPMPLLITDRFGDVIELLEELYNLSDLRYDNEIFTIDLFNKTKELISSNLHLPLIRRVNAFQLDISDTYLFLFLTWQTLAGNETSDIDGFAKYVFDRPSERVKYMQKIRSGENSLIKNSLIEIIEASFFNDTEVKLTDNSLNILVECELKLYAKKKMDNLVKPEQIAKRVLVFNRDEMRQLGLLKNLLRDPELSETQNRLAGRSLPRGIAVILHGGPGTGKTEAVMQLARDTGREIMKVDISQSKSMWFGESEKIIKRIFTGYRSYAGECERIPILLFNEADGILSKRLQVGNSGVRQTENAIQNIILEEMENFEGVMIATTNLISNLDPAFERRFLFKIELRKPDISVRAKIWKLKLPRLSIRECQDLSVRFDFSGGQIDNIARKSEIDEIVNGTPAGYKGIVEFCREETLVHTRMPIGF